MCLQYHIHIINGTSTSSLCLFGRGAHKAPQLVEVHRGQRLLQLYHRSWLRLDMKKIQVRAAALQMQLPQQNKALHKTEGLHMPTRTEWQIMLQGLLTPAEVRHGKHLQQCQDIPEKAGEAAALHQHASTPPATAELMSGMLSWT